MIRIIDKLVTVSEMDNELDFDPLCQTLCQYIIDIFNMLNGKLTKEVFRVMRENEEVMTKNLFSKIFGKGILAKKDEGEFLSSLQKDKENKIRDMRIKIEHLANSAKKYDIFLYPKEIKENLIFLTKLVNFLTVASNNSFFYRYFAIKINLGEAKETTLSKNFMNTLHDITSKCNFDFFF